MKRIAILLLSMLACSLTWAADSGEVTVEKLLVAQKSWDDKTYPAYPVGQPEVTVLRITIPPKTSLDWHRHPVINIGYMLAGSLEVENQATGEKKLIRTGDTLPELVGTTHRGRNPGDEPATILVFYAGVIGSALSEK